MVIALINKERQENRKAFYHLPGLFEFYELYRVFLPLYFGHPEYFYDWCGIGSIYGAPADCLWGGGRAGYGETPPQEAAALLKEFGISARLTFSNSLLREEHLSDRKCNALCALFENSGRVPAGVILSSDLLLDYLKERYPGLYFVSSTTKVLTEFKDFELELIISWTSLALCPGTRKKRWNFSATSAAGSSAPTGKPATKMSAGKIWGRTARITSASRPPPPEATASLTP